MANPAMLVSLLLSVIGVLNLAVLVMQAYFLLITSSQDDKNCTRLCLPCETVKDRVCCGCHVDSLKGYLTKVRIPTLKVNNESYPSFVITRLL